MLRLALELRAVPAFAGFWAAWPLLARIAPKGDGHPVLVLPGLTMGDRSTFALRFFLASRGYDVHGWELGLNHGPRPGVAEAMKDRLRRLSDRQGRAASLVGWSLGGIYARQLAKIAPAEVRCVVTLASPFNGDPRATNVWQVYERYVGGRIEDQPPAPGGPLEEAPPVPSTAIFSRGDGLCAWRLCRGGSGPLTENVEVFGSHLGLGHNPAAAFVVADRLAQSEGAWRPFERRKLRKLFFPDPERR